MQGETAVSYSGDYKLTGPASTANTIQIQSGTHRITLNNVTVSIPGTKVTNETRPHNVCAFLILGDSAVTIILEGENSLSSAGGCAGIYIAPEAELLIEGDGNLTVRGGAGQKNFIGGGSGIGGNGHCYNYNKTESHFGYGEFGAGEFGKMTVNAGNLHVFGGASSDNNLGAGAGIGSGGLNNGIGYITTPSGMIFINGGTVITEGGKGGSQSSDTLGGAGIGTGGAGDSPWRPAPSNVGIQINGGEITATGYNDSAGIGGGANVNSGTIEIGGDAIVTAIGGDEGDGSTWGGAGIGGGDNGWANDISITGNADVTAYGKGGGAGIGGGNGGGNGGGIWITDNDGGCVGPGKIVISENAEMTAVGGSYATLTGNRMGGAGIGSGRNTYSSYGDILLCSNISIGGNAKVNAFGGDASAGIGAGSDGGIVAMDENDLFVLGSITIKDNAQVTAVGGSGGVYYSDNVYEIGAAGIGAAYSFFIDNPSGNITIRDGADVTAYAGKKAQAVGVGAGFEGEDECILNIEGAPELRFFNQDEELPATVSINVPERMIYYTLPTGETFPATGVETETGSFDNYTWSYSGASENYELEIFNGPNLIFSAVSKNTGFGNWAILMKASEKFSVIFDSRGGSTISPMEDVLYNDFIGKPADPVRAGYDFDGWFKEEVLESEWDFDTDTVTADMILYAGWKINQTSSIGGSKTRSAIIGKNSLPSEQNNGEAGESFENELLPTSGQEILPETDEPNGWAVLNIAAVLGSLFVTILLAIGIRKRRGEEDAFWNKPAGIKILMMTFGIGIGPVLFIVFLLTQEIKSPMILSDNLTMPMFLILATQVLAAGYIFRRI